MIFMYRSPNDGITFVEADAIHYQVFEPTDNMTYEAISAIVYKDFDYNIGNLYIDMNLGWNGKFYVVSLTKGTENKSYAINTAFRIYTDHGEKIDEWGAQL